MSKLQKKVNHYESRYRQYIRKSVSENSRRSIIEAREKGEEYDKQVKNHLVTFDNTNQTIIGGQFFTLLYQARFEKDKYLQNRVDTLKEIYRFVVDNRAWYDLWKTFMTIENKTLDNKSVTEHQIMMEVNDMFRLSLTSQRWIIGLTNKQTAIFNMPNFYITSQLLDMFENKGSIGRKKTKELLTVQYQSADLMSYHSYSFGLYDEDTLDLLPSNGLKYDSIQNGTIKPPRMLAEWHEIAELIDNERHYTMNPNGVVIDCYNCGSIDQIILVEREGFLLWKIRLREPGSKLNHRGELVDDLAGSDYVGYFNPELYPRSIFSEHSDYIDFEFLIYGFILECYADIVCGASIVNNRFKRDVINVGTMDMVNENTDVLGDRIGIRFIPRQVHKKIKKETKSHKEYESEVKKYFVIGHIRKLPEGHSPSKEAMMHAQEFGIELPINYTFVRPYEPGEEKIRSHYIKKI